jgi:hypothetical protein
MDVECLSEGDIGCILADDEDENEYENEDESSSGESFRTSSSLKIAWMS